MITKWKNSRPFWKEFSKAALVHILLIRYQQSGQVLVLEKYIHENVEKMYKQYETLNNQGLTEDDIVSQMETDVRKVIFDYIDKLSQKN